MDFLLKFELASDPQMMSVVRSAVSQFAAVVGFDEAECRSITLAIDEALTNVIRHAYGNRHDQPIRVTCRRISAVVGGANSGGVEFLLEDQGRATDPASLRSRPLAEVRPGGLGIHLISQVMDQVEYRPLPDQNQLRLVKYLHPKPATGE